jgi:hypothetical protein
VCSSTWCVRWNVNTRAATPQCMSTSLLLARAVNYTVCTVPSVVCAISRVPHMFCHGPELNVMSTLMAQRTTKDRRLVKDIEQTCNL